MTDSLLTSRIIAFLPSQNCPANAEILNKLDDVCAKHELSICRKTPYFLACKTQSINSNYGDKQFLLCDVLPGKLSSPREITFAETSSLWEGWHAVAEQHAQLYNLLLSNKKEFAIESDILGLKPLYLASIEEGTLIGSSLTDLFRLKEDLIRPIDSMGLAQLILTGHPFGSRTIHAKVRRTKTGERLYWDADSKQVSSSRPRRIQISKDVRADAGLLESVQEIDAAISESINRHTQGAAQPLNIGLSGGFDSRILAAVLNKQRKRFESFTYGHWHHREVRTANRIAQQLDTNHQVLPYPLDNHYDRMELFLSTMEGQSDSNSVQIANLLQMNTPVGSPILHGFMSDAVAVTRFSDKKNGIVPKSLEQAANNLASSIIKSDSHSKLVSELVGTDVTAETIFEEVLNDMHADGLAYHSAVLWDVENRQRRFIAGHLPMLGQKFDVIVPFYDARLMSVWFSLPRISLDERYLQRQQLAKLYPNLAKIPHSEENAPIIPNLSNQLRLLADSVVRKAFISTYQKFVGYRTSNIWSLSGGMATAEQQKRMQKLFSANLDQTKKVLGLSSFDDENVMSYFETGPQHGDYITPRIIFQTSAYANWLSERL